ncbi:MAG: NifB/NifX family molybdenum-iron cluster-binding protein, partial [Methanosarcinaceae archaeon]
FGRCQYFVIADPDTMTSEGIENSAASASGGAGIQAAQNIVSLDIDVLITGNIGPNAHQVLSAANIKMATGASGTIADAIKQYMDGKLALAGAPTAAAHAGMGQGMGGGRGRGQR